MRWRVVVATALLGLAGCQRGDAGRTTTTTLPPTTTTAVRQPHAIGEFVPTPGGNRVRVTGWDAGPITTTLIRQPTPGQRYAAAEVEGCTGSDGFGSRLRPSQFGVELVDGTRWQSTVPAKRPRLDEDRSLARDECTSGWVTFEVPADGKVRFVFFDAGPSQPSWLLPDS